MIRLLNTVLEHPTVKHLSGPTFAVLSVICYRAQDNYRARVSRQQLIRETHCSRRTVMRSLRSLEASGFIRTFHPPGQVNVYEVVPERFSRVRKRSVKEGPAWPPPELVTQGPAWPPPELPLGGASVAPPQVERGASVAPPRGQPGPPLPARSKYLDLCTDKIPDKVPADIDLTLRRETFSDRRLKTVAARLFSDGENELKKTLQDALVAGRFRTGSGQVDKPALVDAAIDFVGNHAEIYGNGPVIRAAARTYVDRLLTVVQPTGSVAR